MIFPPKTCKEDITRRSFFSWIKRWWELRRATKAHLRVRSSHLRISQCHRGHPKRVPQSPQHISRIVKDKHQETLNLQSTHKRGNHSWKYSSNLCPIDRCHLGLGDYTRYRQVSTSNPIHRRRGNIMGERDNHIDQGTSLSPEGELLTHRHGERERVVDGEV